MTRYHPDGTHLPIRSTARAWTVEILSRITEDWQDVEPILLAAMARVPEAQAYKRSPISAASALTISMSVDYGRRWTVCHALDKLVGQGVLERDPAGVRIRRGSNYNDGGTAWRHAAIGVMRQTLADGRWHQAAELRAQISRARPLVGGRRITDREVAIVFNHCLVPVLRQQRDVVVGTGVHKGQLRRTDVSNGGHA